MDGGRLELAEEGREVRWMEEWREEEGEEEGEVEEEERKKEEVLRRASEGVSGRVGLSRGFTFGREEKPPSIAATNARAGTQSTGEEG